MRAHHVFVVLEHATKEKDALLHGVYYNERWANAKKIKEQKKNEDCGYICVLKKEIKRRNTKNDVGKTKVSDLWEVGPW